MKPVLKGGQGRENQKNLRKSAQARRPPIRHRINLLRREQRQIWLGPQKKTCDPSRSGPGTYARRNSCSKQNKSRHRVETVTASDFPAYNQRAAPISAAS